MIGKFLGSLIFLFAILGVSNTAEAACTVPNTLANGTTADATPVMGNFTSIAGCAAPLASPSFTGSISLSSLSASPALTVSGTSFSSNVLFKSTGGPATLTLDAGTGSPSEIYNSINGSAIWATGITLNGPTNSFAWYSYGISATAFYITTTGNAAVGGCLTYNGGTLGTCLSDARAKKNVSPFRLGLQQVAALNPVTYEYNGVGEGQDDGKVRTGLVAQDVQAVVPELVQSGYPKLVPEGKELKPLLAIKYGDLTFALINAVKELKVANDNQAARIDQLEKRVVSLQRREAQEPKLVVQHNGATSGK